jgi:formylmethanofuran dehydrogenase subunit C
MSSLTLSLRQPIAQRIDMSPFTPEFLTGRSADEIARIPLWLGNRQIESGELFRISGNSSQTIIIRSESDRLERIGAGMRNGTIIVEGNTGAYLGMGMSGGEITITGDAGVAAGCAMKAGRLTVHGNTGDFLGGALTGERQGMAGGIIVVKGDVGDRAGDLMRRGVILISGDTGDYCASRMVAGTLIVCGQTGSQTGLGMRRGSVISGSEPASLPATFNDNGVHSLSFLALLTQELATETDFPELTERGTEVQRWLGDLSCGGQGEILIWRR